MTLLAAAANEIHPVPDKRLLDANANLTTSSAVLFPAHGTAPSLVRA